MKKPPFSKLSLAMTSIVVVPLSSPTVGASSVMSATALTVTLTVPISVTPPELTV